MSRNVKATVYSGNNGSLQCVDDTAQPLSALYRNRKIVYCQDCQVVKRDKVSFPVLVVFFEV